MQDEFIEKLKPRVNFITACPECEIGLGVPRDPIRIVFQKGSYILMQLNSEKDITDKMNKFVSGYFKSIKEIDGFILKARSPSCGIKDVEVYSGINASRSTQKTSGFFGREILRHFPNIAVETEATLANSAIRGHFMARVFASASLRGLKRRRKL